MDTIGYIYYSDGTREEAAHLVHGSGRMAEESARRDVEQSTAKLFDFKLKTIPKDSYRRPTRYDVQQFR